MINFKKTNQKYGCFSNFYPCTVELDGVVYQSAEAAWQAQKCVDSVERERFINLSARDAKKLGRKVKLRHDWEDVKYMLMKAVLASKFLQHPDLWEVLDGTGDEVLVEDTTSWHDNLWGVCYCSKCGGRGNNWLGIALMETRTNIRNSLHIGGYENV